MALPTFNPVPAPSVGTKNAPKVKIMKAEFGEGYSQRTRDSLNHIRAVVELTWTLLTPAQGKALKNFFEERGGDRAFWYQTVLDDVRKKWTCEVWTHGTAENGFHTFSATLEQSFTLEV